MVYLSLVTEATSAYSDGNRGVRLYTIRAQTECVMDMAMDSALAEYLREPQGSMIRFYLIWDVYF